MKKEACGTFGKPVKALRNDPSNFLKKGKRLHADQVKRAGAAVGSAFVYTGDR